MASASRGIILLLSLSMAIPSVAAPPAMEQHPTKEGAQFFEKQIRPILVQNCYQCHSGDPKKAKANFVLDTREGLQKGGKSGPVINPAHPEQSLLIEAVRYESLEMPPGENSPTS
ncbi:MAG TPA: c-type cytochrome domain-containing protein [Pirellulales bacterium]|nr:c-type cytochrome domain-containing protein [Pirellulales bacterium]